MIRASFPGAGLFATTLLLALVALGGALAGANLAAHAEAEAARANGLLMVRVLSPATPEGVSTAAAVLRRTPGVTAVRPMDAARAAELLASQGGGAVDPADLPALHLIEVTRAPEADTRIRDALRGTGLRTELYGAEPAGPLSARSAQLAIDAALAAVAALLLAIGLTFSAAAGANGAAAHLGADLGATRPEVLAAYGRTAFATAFAAGAAAAVICTLAAPGVLMTLGETLSLEAMIRRISPVETALVLLAPTLSAIAATLGARAGAARVFDRADRLG